MENWPLLRDRIVADFADPAEVVAVSFRMAGRLQPQSPELARALLKSGPGVLTHDRGLAPRARRDIVAATQAGRSDVVNPDIALMAAGGCLLADAATLSDEMAKRVLRMLGLTKREASRLCARPLPPQPQP